MRLIALLCYFLAMFGATWLMCARASDWNTDRWNQDSRWIPLVFGAMAWLAAFMWLGQQAFPGNARKSTEMTIALIAGLPTGIAFYALFARVKPGLAGARRMAPSSPVMVPRRRPSTLGEWLLLDLRALPKLLRGQWKKK